MESRAGVGNALIYPMLVDSKGESCSEWVEATIVRERDSQPAIAELTTHPITYRWPPATPSSSTS
jgi:hypothetical protein